MSELAAESVAAVETAPAVDASASPFSEGVRAKLAAAAANAKAAKEQALESTHDEPAQEPSTVDDQEAAGQADEAKAEQASEAKPELDKVFAELDAATERVAKQWEEAQALRNKFEKLGHLHETFVEDPVASVRAFVLDALGIDDKSPDAERHFLEVLTELNVEAGGDLVPTERKYETLKKRTEREKTARERRAARDADAKKASDEEATKAANLKAAHEHIRESKKVFDSVREIEDGEEEPLRPYPYLALEPDFDAQIYDLANERFLRTGVVPAIDAVAAEVNERIKKKFERRIKRFQSPAQPSTQAPKASTQTVATSKAPRATTKASAPATEESSEAWSRDGSRNKLLERFRGSVR